MRIRPLPPGYTLRLVAETDVALPDLQPLAEQIHGAHARPRGWFTRKLAREGVDPARSVLAFGPGGERVGYMLVGDEPGESVAHCAGLGVLEQFRRRGIGPAMVARAAAALHAADLTHLRALSEPPRRGFYEHLGFQVRRQLHTLHARATGEAPLDFSVHPPTAWSLPGHPVAGWRAGTWSRTPTSLAASVTLADGAASAHLSREGRAILVQRLCVAEQHASTSVEITQRALEDLRSRFVHGTSLLLYGCDPVSCVTAFMRVVGSPWSAVQTAWEADLGLGEGVDKHAAPAA